MEGRLVSVSAPGPKDSNGCGCAGCLGTFIMLGIFASFGFLLLSVMMTSCLYMVARPSVYDATVTLVSWERIIEIERNDPRPKEGPKEEIPPDAIDVKRKGRTKVFTYKVREWGPDRTLRASGTDHTDIRWPADADGKGLEADPNEREARREKYVVTLCCLGNQDVRFVVPDEARFRKFRLQSKHVITRQDGQLLVDGERYNNH
jgi:hypothetical protein